MSLKVFVDRLQIAALVVAAVFVVLLFTGWPGAGDQEAPGGPVPSETTEFPSTSEAPDTSESPETTEG